MRNLAEWKYVQDPEHAFEGEPTLDLAESDAMTRCVSAFALYRPDKSLRVHVPWCENDYQIDAGTPAGRTEWKRIVDQMRRRRRGQHAVNHREQRGGPLE